MTTTIDPRKRPYRRHGCRYRGCAKEATCLPQIYVPPSQFSNKPDVAAATALMGMPLCEDHFRKITAKELLEGNMGAPVRDSLAQALRERGAIPNFEKAVVGRVSRRDHDWFRWEEMNDRARAN